MRISDWSSDVCSSDLHDQLVEQIEVPTETVTEARRGKKVQVERKFMPGYVLARLNMTDDVYHLVKNTPKVTGFLGSSGKPQPISDKEAARMLNSKEEAAAAPKTQIKVDYEIGDAVKVLEGPFASFNGTVEELDFDKAKVKVSVSIRSEEHTSELQSLMRISYAVFCLKKKNNRNYKKNLNETKNTIHIDIITKGQ